MSQPQDFESILDEAQRLVTSDRNYQYGPWEEESARVCMIMDILAPLDAGAFQHGRNATARFTLSIVVLKMVRDSYRHKRDNLVDACGYLKLLEDIYNPCVGGEKDDPEAVAV
jgi:hypothetical protein